MDSARTTFQITAPYQPFPDLDPNTIVIVNYKDEVPSTIDARAKADLVINWTVAEKVTGTVVLGRFKGEPSGTPRAGDSTDAGGLGKPALKYWGVGVQGFSNGSAQITTFYHDDELKGVPANTLFMGYRPSAAPRWMKFDNQGVFPNAQNARGDIGVSVLNASPVIGLASEPPRPVEVAGVQDAGWLSHIVGYWPILVILLVLVGPSSVVLILTRRRKG